MSNNRVISVSGLAFAISTFVGLMLLLGGAAVGQTTNAEAAEWLAESSHRTRMIIGMYVMCGGAVAFILFAACLLQLLRQAEAPSLEILVAELAAIAFAILTLAAAVGMASAAYAVASNVEPEPIDPGAVRVSTFGFTLWAIPAALAGALFVGSVSAAVYASGALPRWLALIGILLAVVALFGIMFLPTLGLLVWAILVAIATLVQGKAPALGHQRPSPA